jgi:hypothetical protein
MCTNTSWLPSSGWMNPKPFWLLNHFTVPCITTCLSGSAPPGIPPRWDRKGPTHLRQTPWSLSVGGSDAIIFVRCHHP